MGDTFDPKQFRLTEKSLANLTQKTTEKWRYIPKKGERFLKGPIPLVWLNEAAMLPGCAFQVAVRIWYLSGLKWSKTVKLNQSAMGEAGVLRDAARRGLEQLESAKLVHVERKPGCAPVVTLLLPEPPCPEGYQNVGDGDGRG